MINGQELNIALGNPIWITGFTDNKPRLCYPYKLKDINELQSYLQFIKLDKYEDNFLKNESIVSINMILTQSFKDDEVSTVLAFIDKTNFKEIFTDIKTVNGIDSVTQEIPEEFKDMQGGIDWSTSINAVMTYTANSMNDVKEMTYGQFNSCLSYIGRIITWNYKVSTVGLVKEPDEYIDEDDYPLAQQHKKKDHMTMSDLSGFKEG